MATSTQNKPSSLPHPNPTKSFWHSEPAPLLLGHRSTRDLPESVDVVVVGSGITGASVAHHLLKEGNERQSVLMLEAREACWGATGRNGGHCHPLLWTHPTDPSIGHFELSNFAALSSLATQLPSAEFAPQPGVLALFTTSSIAAATARLSTLQTHDPDLAQKVRIVTHADDLSELRLGPTAKGAVISEVAARMWPYKFVAGILEGLLLDERVGKRFNLQTHTAVTELRRVEGKGWRVRTGRGDVLAKRVVLATNGYTSHLLPGFADLIVPCRGQMAALTPPESLAGQNRLRNSLVFETNKEDYLIQRPTDKGEQLMFGGGKQFGDTTGNADDSVIDEQSAKYLRTALVENLGLEDTKELTAEAEWSGIMGFSRDEHPFVGQVPGHEGVFVSAGYTGHGMPNAWLCGKAVASMVDKSAGGMRVEDAVEETVNQVKLPRSYLVDKARLARLKQLPTVLEQDRMNVLGVDGCH